LILFAVAPSFTDTATKRGAVHRNCHNKVPHAYRFIHSVLYRCFFPEVGIATLELLERFGNEVVYPQDQTCCGQPMANSGFNADSADTEALFVRNFSGFDYVVAPSGSCVERVRVNFDAVEQTPEVKNVRGRTYELVEFLHDIQKADAFPWARFPHWVGLHNSCGTLRRLKHATPSELHEPLFSKPMDLLSKVEAIQFVNPACPHRRQSPPRIPPVGVPRRPLCRVSRWPVGDGRYRGGTHPRCPGRPVAFRLAPDKGGAKARRLIVNLVQYAAR
jgi:cysteine-rich protein